MIDQQVTVRGWIPVRASSDIAQGAAAPLRVQGQELVIWRGESGEVHVLDAFCRHLGHHLGYKGRVCGEDVRCFYHGWTWSPEGKNTDIPYDSRTYRGRRMTPWTVTEAAGWILLWHEGTASSSEPLWPSPGDAGELSDPPRATSAPYEVWTERTADLRILMENLLDPKALVATVAGRLMRSTVKVDSPSSFELVHVVERGGKESAVTVSMYGPLLARVTTTEWTLTVGVCPTVAELIDVRADLAVAADVDPAQAESLRTQLMAAVSRQIDLAEQMVHLDGTAGQDPAGALLSDYRTWAASFRADNAEATAGADVDTEEPTVPAPVG